MKRTVLARMAVAFLTIAATSVVAVAAAAPASATTTTYTASTGFTGTQGQNQWSYQRLTGTTYSNLATYTSGTNPRWAQTAGSYPWVGAGDMHPENTYAAVRKWLAPGAGTVSISGTVHKGDAIGDGVVASIRKNATVLWSATVTSPTNVTPTGVSSISVAAGDALYFVVDKNGNMNNDQTFWNPVVSFTDNASGQPANSLSVVTYGATANDSSDDLAAFNSTVSAAISQGKTVWVPAGTFRLSNVLQLNGVKLAGAGQTQTTLLSTNATNGTIRLSGNNAAISNVKHEYQTVGARDDLLTSTSILLDGATNFRVEGVWVLKSGSAGIFAFGASAGAITGNKVQNTNADAIHMTNGSHDITVSSNYVSAAGDDTISVVSYIDETPTNHITIQNNDVGYNSLARGISVVGGQDITISGNSINNTQYAGIYISVEAEYNTRDTLRVTLTGNTVDHCALNTSSGHPNVLVYGSQGTIDEITFTNNIVKNSAGGGIGVWGDATIGDIYFNTNTVSNSAGAATEFDSGTIHLNGNTGF